MDVEELEKELQQALEQEQGEGNNDETKGESETEPKDDKAEEEAEVDDPGVLPPEIEGNNSSLNSVILPLRGVVWFGK